MARLLFVLDIGFDRGGPSVHLLQDVIRAGLKQGHEIEVILKKTNGPNEEMPEEFINNKNFSYFTITEDEDKNSGFVTRYLNEVRYARKCSKIFLNQRNYDAVFLQSNTVAIFYIRLLKRLKCRIIFNVQDIFPYNLKLSGQLPFEHITFPILKKLQRAAYKRADCIITISDDMKQTLIYDGVETGKIKVIYNWSYDDSVIDFNSISKENISKIIMDHNKYNVVYAGNIGKMQNVELIAETAKYLEHEDNIFFYIIGDGANLSHVKKIVEGLKNIALLPIQPSKYAESIYAQADLNVIPLMPGGIKTALPSKTATVLRVNRPVLFCIDADSEFAQYCSQLEQVEMYDVREGKCEDLAIKILDLSHHNSTLPAINRIDEISRFSKKNSYEYIETMVSGI